MWVERGLYGHEKAVSYVVQATLGIGHVIGGLPCNPGKHPSPAARISATSGHPCKHLGVIASGISGYLSDRIGRRWSAIISVAALYLLSRNPHLVA